MTEEREFDVPVPQCFRCEAKALPGVIHCCYQYPDRLRAETSFRNAEMIVLCMNCLMKLRSLYGAEDNRTNLYCRHCRKEALFLLTQQATERHHQDIRALTAVYSVTGVRAGSGALKDLYGDFLDSVDEICEAALGGRCFARCSDQQQEAIPATDCRISD